MRAIRYIKNGREMFRPVGMPENLWGCRFNLFKDDVTMFDLVKD